VGGSSVSDPPVVPWLLLVAHPAATIFHGLNMVLFGCCSAFTFCWFGLVVADAFVICPVTVDALSIISSLSLLVCVGGFVDCVPCEAFGIGAVVLVGFVNGGGFVTVIGDLCYNGIVSTSSWVVFACFLAVLAWAFFIPVIVPFSADDLGLKYVSIVAVVGESTAFGFIMVLLLLQGFGHRLYSFFYSKV